MLKVVPGFWDWLTEAGETPGVVARVRPMREKTSAVGQCMMQGLMEFRTGVLKKVASDEVVEIFNRGLSTILYPHRIVSSNMLSLQETMGYKPYSFKFFRGLLLEYFHRNLHI
jgi:hypothetical protein